MCSSKEIGGNLGGNTLEKVLLVATLRSLGRGGHVDMVCVL